MPNRSPHFCLAAICALLLVSQGTFTLDVVRAFRGRYPANPLTLGDPWPTIAVPGALELRAGLKKGDRVVSIDGQAPSGDMDVLTTVHGKSPGQFLTVAVERGGVLSEHRVEVPALSGVRVSFYGVVAWLLMPWFSIAVAIWVAALRPRDRRAWFVLGILVGMSGLARPGINSLGWGWAGLAFAIFQGSILFFGWGVAMMLFGMYFPKPWNLNQKLPWLKWALIAPAILLALLQAVAITGFAVARASTLWRPVLFAPAWLGVVLVMVMHSFFFFGLSAQLRSEELARDDQRRLRLLYFGCTLAMAPMFLLFLWAFAVHRGMPVDSGWVTFGLLMMFLFPVTMAYVIVVERAMDVRMAIRQGVQYALARRGIRAMQSVFTAGIAFLAASALDSKSLSRPWKVALIGLGVLLILRLRDLGERVRRWLDRRFFREAYNAEHILGELSDQVRTILDRDTLLETVARRLSESLHVERIAVMLRDGTVFRPAFATGYAALPTVTITAEAAENDPRGAAQSLGAELLLPLASKKELLGFLSLGPKKSEEPYSPSDTSLLRTVAAQTGMALENSRLSEAIAAEVSQRELMYREIEIAREVQERLFPQNLPPVASLEYAGHCRPARGIGGDYYDFLAIANGRLGLAIGDVSGKGVPAALLMASLQASVRGQAQAFHSNGRPDIAALMENVNRLVFDASQSNRYATFFYGQFDPAARRLVYTNGGHNPPILIRGGEVLRLETGGPPVGLFRASKYEQAEIDMQPGDLLILYTDGVSEAENPSEEEWGEDALIASVRSHSSLMPAEMITRIIAGADAFAAGAPQHDDMTLVIARVLQD